MLTLTLTLTLTLMPFLSTYFFDWLIIVLLSIYFYVHFCSQLLITVLCMTLP
jgi:hypothetical protein